MKQQNTVLKALAIAFCCLITFTGFAQEMQIVNSGQLYSTYKFTPSDEAEIKKQVSSYEFDKIQKYCHEDAWPSGIETNDKWSKNKYEMNNYKVYKVATFSDKVIIVAPEGENQHMAYDLRPSGHDIYFIIGTSGVQEKNAQANTGGSMQEMKITNSGQLYSTYKIEGSEETSLRNQVSGYEFAQIMKYCHEDAWPTGISTNDKWSKNKYAMNDYKVYKVATIGDKYILLAPKDENQHMPWDLRPTSHDLYFIIGKTGVTEKSSSYSSNYTKVPGVEAKINETGGLYSTYNLATDSYADDVRKQVGGEFDDIVKYSREENWPSGIASLSARDDVRSKMNNYKAYKIASFDGKYILRLPAAENTFMPYNMQASNDIYFIIKQENVSVTGSSYNYNTSSTNTGGTPAKITETGGLYSTYNLSTDSYAGDVQSQVGSEWKDVLKYSQEDQWPSGIATLSARDAVRSKMTDYKAYKIASFDGKYVLRIPAAENKFMPYNMQPSHDIYFIIRQDNVSLTGSGNTGGSKTPGKAVTINATGGLYSDFNLATSSYAGTVKAQVGTEYDDVIKYSNDDNWPYGIATFDKREQVRTKMNDYKGYVIASFDNKYVLRIPMSENQFMPYDLRPTHDIYFIINQTDVTVKGGAGNTNYNSNNPKPIGSE